MLWQHFAYALRTMRKHPAFATTTILTLALGIGANTAIFTIINSVLLKPLAFQQPDQLIRITGGATNARYEEFRTSQSLTDAGAFVGTVENVTLTGVDGPEPLKGARITANFLSILGVPPLQGRVFQSEEPGVAMISSALWRRRFGGDPRIVGGTVRLGGAQCTIVGVLPEGFQFPLPDVDVWRPWEPASMPTQSRLNSPILTIFGRLRPGISLSQATAELNLVDRRYALANPGKLDAKLNRPEQFTLLKDHLVRDVRSMLWMLFGAVGFVLLIACANIAGLLLARTTSRSREFAIRAALGAGRSHLIRQMLSESLLLALPGGALGVLFATWSLRAIAQMPGLDLPRIGEVHLDAMVLVFAIALSVITSVLFGLAPSLSASRPDLVSVMKANGEAALKGWSGRLSPRGLLVIGQVALSIVLLIGAALLIESMGRLRNVDTGFQSANVLTMQIALPPARYDELVQRVQSVPGVRSAAVTLTLPMTGWAGTPVHAVGQPMVPLNQRPIAILQLITPGYFNTMGITFKRGQDFSRQDTASSPLVAIINETLARRFWPSYPEGEDPVGHFLLAGANPGPLRIVGIVSDVRQAGLSEEAEPGLYRPRTQTPPLPAMFAVRTDGDPLRFVHSIRAQVSAIDPDQTIASVKTMEQVVDASEGQRRSIMILLELFAFAGLSLALIGIYGVISYSVAQRTREMGIRKALGAQNRNILALVLKQGAILAFAGALLGVAGALALTRVLKTLLFQVSATDPLTFAGIALLAILAALAASYLPARRAVRVEPTAAIRGV